MIWKRKYNTITITITINRQEDLISNSSNYKDVPVLGYTEAFSPLGRMQQLVMITWPETTGATSNAKLRKLDGHTSLRNVQLKINITKIIVVVVAAVVIPFSADY